MFVFLLHVTSEARKACGKKMPQVQVSLKQQGLRKMPNFGSSFGSNFVSNFVPNFMPSSASLTTLALPSAEFRVPKLAWPIVADSTLEACVGDCRLHNLIIKF